MKLIRLIEENNNGYLKLRKYLHGTKYRNCKKEVMSGGIEKNEESSKTLFNQKNILLTYKVCRTLKDIYYNFCIHTKYFVS